MSYTDSEVTRFTEAFTAALRRVVEQFEPRLDKFTNLPELPEGKHLDRDAKPNTDSTSHALTWVCGVFMRIDMMSARSDELETFAEDFRVALIDLVGSLQSPFEILDLPQLERRGKHHATSIAGTVTGTRIDSTGAALLWLSDAYERIGATVPADSTAE